MQQLVPSNPNRFSLLISADERSDLRIFTNPNITINSGIGVPRTTAAGAPLLLTYKLHGAMVQDAWWCIGTVANFASVIENTMGGMCDD